MIHQGRLYRVLGYGQCIALESKDAGYVRCLADPKSLWPYTVDIPVPRLHPAPMRYHGNEIPS